MNKTSETTLSQVLANVFLDIIFFPFWWYSFGLIKTIKKLGIFLADREKSLALFIWVKNIFIPMYGQRDITGILISFFVRLSQIIFRALIMFFWILFAFVSLSLWLILPILIVYEIIQQLL